MKTWSRFIFFTVISMMLLTACSQDNDAHKFSLMNQDNEEVNVIGQKPALFFFFTTYT